MVRVKGWIGAALIMLAVACPVWSQDQMEPQALLKKVSETYKNLKRYHFEGVTVMESKAGEGQVRSESRSEETFSIAAVKPDRMRGEMRSPTFSLLTVSDGRTDWVLASATNQYTKKPAGQKGRPGAGGLDPVSSWVSRSTSRLAEYERLADRAKEAKILREEAVEVSGGRVNCYVVEVEYQPTVGYPNVPSSRRTLWVDKARYLVLRSITTTKYQVPYSHPYEVKNTTTFTTAKVDEPLPDTLFVFVPPEGAKEVEEWSFPGLTTRPEVKRAEFIGKEATDFTLKDLDGKEFNLQSLRGKVVLLDFWATWCGPCRVELPYIEKLHREFKDKDLLVLGIDDEEPEVARDFMKKSGYTFTTLVDDQHAAAQSYQINLIPQVLIIGKDGKVVNHYFGTKGEDELRAGLQKAGINTGEVTRAGSGQGAEPPKIKNPTSPAPMTVYADPKALPESKGGPGKGAGIGTGEGAGVGTGQGSSAGPGPGEIEEAGKNGAGRPVILYRERAKYTEEAARNKVQGVVVLSAIFTSDGRITGIKVVRSLPDGLTEKAIEAAQKIRFRPATKNGQPISVRMQIEYSFALEANPAPQAQTPAQAGAGPLGLNNASPEVNRAPAGLNRFTGTWKNISLNTGGITSLEIKLDGTKVMVQAWGKCHPADCDWGQVEAQPYGPSVSSNLAAATQVLSAVFQPGFSQRLMLIYPEGKDRLRVEVLTRYTDRSGRSNFRSIDTLARELSASAPLSSASEGNGSTSDPKERKISVSGGVLQGNAIKKVQPPYPVEAKAAHASGAVQVQVTISEDGRVIEAEIVSGHPLLREASLVAARQWVFKPFELSGVAVKVRGVLIFNFTLPVRYLGLPGCPGRCFAVIVALSNHP